MLEMLFESRPMLLIAVRHNITRHLGQLSFQVFPDDGAAACRRTVADVTVAQRKEGVANDHVTFVFVHLEDGQAQTARFHVFTRHL